MTVDRTISVPYLSPEIENVLVLARRIHLGDPRSFWYDQTRLSPTSENDFVRRVAYYISLLYEASDAAYEQIEADLAASLKANAEWRAWLELQPRHESVIAPRPPASSNADKAANTAKLLAQLQGSIQMQDKANDPD